MGDVISRGTFRNCDGTLYYVTMRTGEECVMSIAYQPLDVGRCYYTLSAKTKGIE